MRCDRALCLLVKHSTNRTTAQLSGFLPLLWGIPMNMVTWSSAGLVSWSSEIRSLQRTFPVHSHTKPLIGPLLRGLRCVCRIQVLAAYFFQDKCTLLPSSCLPSLLDMIIFLSTKPAVIGPSFCILSLWHWLSCPPFLWNLLGALVIQAYLWLKDSWLS